MMEAEFNDNQRKKRVKRTKPPHIPQEMWERDKRLYKDRFYVAARLKEENWKKFMLWLKINNLNTNSGLNRLIQNHPDLQNDV